MPRKPSATQDALERIGLLRQRIAEFELIASGNLLRRTKVCGKPTCRCAQDERERHGPYWEWTRRERRRLVHRVVSSQEAARLAEAIRNGRAIRRLLARWERESIRIIDTQNDTR